jgi:polar amino acid transport system substrate-binding protein
VLATKIGVQIEPVECPRPGAILQGIQDNELDVTFLVADPARLADADFSPPLMQTEYTYLVPAGSSKHSVADIDEPGVRTAVPRGDGSDLRLSQMLKHAELVRADSVAAIIDMVRAGQVDAYARSRVVLLKLSDQAPGSRVLDDGFADIVYVAMVPKGSAGRSPARCQVPIPDRPWRPILLVVVAFELPTRALNKVTPPIVLNDGRELKRLFDARA